MARCCSNDGRSVRGDGGRWKVLEAEMRNGGFGYFFCPLCSLVVCPYGLSSLIWKGASVGTYGDWWERFGENCVRKKGKSCPKKSYTCVENVNSRRERAVEREVFIVYSDFYFYF